MGAYKFDDGPTLHWDATAAPMPEDLREALENPEIEIVAFNATFERLILRHVLGMELPIERFHCTMAHAYELGFVGSLAQVGDALGIEKKKLETGSKLIKIFCQPRKPTKNNPATRVYPKDRPDDWYDLCGYNIGDVDAEHEIQSYLDDYPMSSAEKTLYWLDQHINDRGLPIDRELCEKALLMADKEKEQVFTELRQLTQVNNPNSRVQFMSWMELQGHPMPNLQSATVDEWAARTDLPANVSRALELKQLVSKSSISKFEKILTCANDDDRVRGTLQFCGAQRTHRWAGRLIQPQNFIRTPRGYNPEDCIAQIKAEKHPPKAYNVLAAALRGAICSPEGQLMPISDLSGIEGRVLPWLCNFEQKLEQIARGIDMYLVAAAAIYGVQYDMLTDESPERQNGKVAELALGFQGGWKALNQMARSYGMEEFSEKEGIEIVNAWRRANLPIKQFWYNAETAAKNAVLNPQTTYAAGRLKYVMDGDFLFCILPSGGEIAYYDPEVRGGSLSYMGWNSYTTQWTVIDTYGGKLVENATQATAREVLAHGMVLAEERGFLIVGSVHDELLTCQEDQTLTHVELSEAMATNPPWADGLPLGAKGYTERRYKKD